MSGLTHENYPRVVHIRKNSISTDTLLSFTISFSIIIWPILRSVLSVMETPERRHINVHEVLFTSTSVSSKQKYEQARKMIENAASEQRRSDPGSVTPTTSAFVVTELYNYTGMEDALETEKMKGEDALTVLIAGTRWVYTRAGHTGPWEVREEQNGSKHAAGNPLINNPDIEQLKLAQKRMVAQLGALTRSAPPLKM